MKIELEQEVKEFLKSENHKVLVINGEWGIGKTRSIKNVVQDAKEISLISIDHNHILKELFSEDYNILSTLMDNRIFKGLGMKAAYSGVSLTGQINLSDDKKVLKDASSKLKTSKLSKQKTIIFDDVEGYNGDVNELIRIIQGISKINENTKYIIICNLFYKGDAQKISEIDMLRLVEKLEAKYIVVKNRQWQNIFDEEFKERVAYIEKNKNFQLSNIRILKKIYSKINKLSLEIKNNNKMNSIILKTYFELCSQESTKKNIVENMKPKEREFMNRGALDGFLANEYDKNWLGFFAFDKVANQLLYFFLDKIKYKKFLKNIAPKQMDYQDFCLQSLNNITNSTFIFESRKLIDFYFNKINKKPISPIDELSSYLEFCYIYQVSNKDIMDDFKYYIEKILKVLYSEQTNLEKENTLKGFRKAQMGFSNTYSIIPETSSAQYDLFIQEILILFRVFLDEKKSLYNETTKNSEISTQIFSQFMSGWGNGAIREDKFTDHHFNDKSIREQMLFLIENIYNNKSVNVNIHNFYDFNLEFWPLVSNKTREEIETIAMDEILKWKNKYREDPSAKGVIAFIDIFLRDFKSIST